MLREEGEKYLEEAHRLSIYPRLPSNGIRGSDESHFFNRLSCFVSRVFLSFATQSCAKACTTHKRLRAYLSWRVYQLRAHDDLRVGLWTPNRRVLSRLLLGFLASTPSFGKTLFSFYFLRHCKNKNKISPAVSPSKPRVTWLFLSTYYRVLRNKNIKKHLQ